jgi:outer membrane receptor protein involved in Fe transport
MWLRLCLSAVAGPSDGGESLEDLLDLMDDRLDAPTGVADRQQRASRAASAMVTTLTGEELVALGARDLADALRLLPTFELAGDVWNVTTLVAKATPSDGRVLLLVDGHVWTEGLYGYIPLGNRLPAAAIERIEIIRGPGAAVYGGYAMLAVIKVTTRGAVAEGARVDGTASLLDSGVYGRLNGVVSGGAPIGDGGHLGVTAAAGVGRRTDATWTDIHGDSADVTGSSALDPALLSATFRLGVVDAAVQAERYHSTFRDDSIRLLPREHSVDFSSVNGRLGLLVPLGPRASIRAEARSSWQEPWHSTSFPPESYRYTDDRLDRHLVEAEVRLAPAAEVRVNGGGSLGLLRGHSPTSNLPAGAESDPTFPSAAGWLEGTWTGPLNVTAGVRHDVSAAFLSSATSPRLVIGQAWRAVHFKVAGNGAFRAPDHLQARSPVAPERLWSLEGEVGVAPTPWAYLTGGAWRLWLNGPLEYFYTETTGGAGSEGYVNGPPIGTEGAEATLEVLSGPFVLSAGWMGARASSTGAGPSYAVPDHPDRRLGVASHKAVLRGTWDPGERLVLGSVVTALGSQWAIVALDDDGPVYEELPATVGIDLSCRVRHVGLRGLDVGLAVHDLLDVARPLVQYYDGLHAPLPGLGREVLLQLTWTGGRP